MEIALVVLGVVVMSTAFIVVLFIKAPQQAIRLGDWLRLTNNILVLGFASVLLAGSVFALVSEWDDSSGAGIYLFVGGLVFTIGVLNMGSRHLSGWDTIGRNDLPSRVVRMVRQTRQLWRELILNRGSGGPAGP